MIAWLRQHAQSLKATLRRLVRTPAATVLGVLAIGVALALPLGAWVLVGSAQRLAGQFPGEPQLAVFLAADASREDASRVTAMLAGAPGVRRHRFVPKEEALSELQRAEGMREIVASLGSNPLPDAFVAELAAGDLESGQKLAAQLRQLPKVELVQLDALWIQRLEALLRLAAIATVVLAVLLGVGLVAIMFSAIRQQVLTQHAEVEVSRLIGATNAYIRRPFIYQGVLLGLAGGLTALGIVAACLHALNTEVGQLAATYRSDFLLTLPPAQDLAALVLFAGLLGGVGSFLSVSRYLRSPGGIP